MQSDLYKLKCVACHRTLPGTKEHYEQHGNYCAYSCTRRKRHNEKEYFRIYHNPNGRKPTNRLKDIKADPKLNMFGAKTRGEYWRKYHEWKHETDPEYVIARRLRAKKHQERHEKATQTS